MSTMKNNKSGDENKKENNESEIEVAVHRVASVTLESDSMPGSPVLQKRCRRRRRMLKKETPKELMDVDDCLLLQTKGVRKPDQGDGRRFLRVRMEWEGIGGDGESSLSSSGTESDAGREADDEHSDWVEAVDLPLDHTAWSLPRPEPALSMSPSSAAFLRRLQRFMRNDHQKELTLKQPIRSVQLNRIAQHYGLEVTKRISGAIILRKKK